MVGAYNHMSFRLIWCLSLFSAGLIILGILIYVIAITSSNLSWAFVLCIIAAILALIGGILLIVDRRSHVVIIGGSSGGAVRTTRTTTTVTVTR